MGAGVSKSCPWWFTIFDNLWYKYGMRGANFHLCEFPTTNQNFQNCMTYTSESTCVTHLQKKYDFTQENSWKEIKCRFAKTNATPKSLIAAT